MRVKVNRQLLGMEDLLIGIGTVAQTRSGQQVVVTKINTGDLPYDGVSTLGEKVNQVTVKAQEASDAAMSATNSAIVCAAFASVDYAGFSVVDGDLLCVVTDVATAVPSLVDGEFILTY